MKRVTLPNGDWVDLADRLSYAQARRIHLSNGTPDMMAVPFAALVTGWALRDVNDQAIEFPAVADDGIPLDALAHIPWDVFQLLAAAAVDILPDQPDPKDTDGPSTGSKPVAPSRSRPSSQMRTSSPIIQDGPGQTFSAPRPT